MTGIWQVDSDWHRTPETTPLRPSEVADKTGLGYRDAVKLVKRFGFTMNRRNWYITEARLERAFRELQKEENEDD